MERGHALWFEPKSVCDLKMFENQVKLSSSMLKKGNKIFCLIELEQELSKRESEIKGLRGRAKGEQMKVDGVKEKTPRSYLAGGGWEILVVM